ncbi:MAG TPA: LysR family transcriptional regulator [Polyangiaceae bacterium]|jgi:DNA-binding transcriptional LysR family regulator|nr:LysR family transcriptional regulator [Polyangiaceae bacterium]
MDRLDAMAMLVASVEAGSFSAASRKLGVPLPTISRKVSDLEAHLKTRLLVRSTRKLVLTEAGASYVTACRRILEDLGEAEAHAAGEYSVPRGDLALTAPIVFGRLHIVPVVNEFLSRFGEINVRMTLSDRNVSLVDDRMDAAVRIGALPDSSLIATRVGAIRSVVCGSPSYFAAHGKPKSPDDLVHHECVTFSEMVAGTPWVFKGRGRQAKFVAPRCRLQINTAEAAVDAAIAGIGIANVLSYQAARAVNEKKLELVLRDFEPPAIPVHFIHAHQGLLPVKLRRFLEFATPRVRKSLLTAHKKLGYDDAESESDE